MPLAGRLQLQPELDLSVVMLKFAAVQALDMLVETSPSKPVRVLFPAMAVLFL